MKSKKIKQNFEETRQKFEEVISDLANLYNEVKELKSLNQKPSTDIEVHFDEVEKLPEKWCVCLENIDDKEAFLNWVNRHKETTFNYAYEIGNKVYFHFPALPFGHTSTQKHYPEISFETFKRLVLKEDEKPVELEIGRWYKEPVTKALLCIESVDNNGITGYGFSISGDWSSSTPWFTNNTEALLRLTPATDEEVKEALIKEAKRRGYKKGNFTPVYPTLLQDLFNGYCYNRYENKLFSATAGQGGAVLFDNGKWAEIISEPEIDFSKAGQLVCTETGLYILTSDRGVHDTTFSGIVVQDNRNTHSYKIGHHSDEWAKEDFILYEGELTLSN